MSAVRLAAPAGLLLLQSTAILAQSVEAPPLFNAARLENIRRVGENYTIQNPVRSDGMLRDYTLTTPYGAVAAQGDDMVRMRINELNALRQLEKVSQSKTFTNALAQAGLNPAKFTGELLTNPLGTIGNTLTGVGSALDRIKSGVGNAGQTPDNAVDGIFGVTSEKRELAVKFGVDPYTDFAPLNEKLTELAKAAAWGGLLVTGALLAVPGAVGLVASNLNTAYKFNDLGLDELARKFTAAQILDLNREVLGRMGVDRALTERLLSNRNYTPIDMAAMVAALNSMSAVRGREIFIGYAATASGRDRAYLIRRQSELTANDYRRHGMFVQFVNLAGYPYLLTRDGRLVAVVPIDALSWTAQTLATFGAMGAARSQVAPNAPSELRITGTATERARRELKAQGWAVLEHQPF